MIKRGKKQQERKKYYRTNDRIYAHTLRVLDTEGKQIGILSKMEALSKARELGLDLVEVAPLAKPPVAKIIDFKKFLYQEEKRKREEKKKAKVSETKEIRLGPFMSDNDLAVSIRRGREFLDDGDKIRLVVKFKGRQITHPEFGHQVVRKVTEALSDISKIDREPHLEGKQLIAVLSVERKKSSDPKAKEDQTNAEKENKEINIKAV